MVVAFFSSFWLSPFNSAKRLRDARVIRAYALLMHCAWPGAPIEEPQTLHRDVREHPMGRGHAVGAPTTKSITSVRWDYLTPARCDPFTVLCNKHH